MSYRKFLQWFQEYFRYVDSITIVDNKGKVVTQKRYNPRFSEEDNKKENQWALNKSILEVIPSVTPETSTLLRVLKTGKIVFEDKQVMWDRKGRKLVCTNLNLPIVSRGKILGAIEISKDITHIEEKYDSIKHFHFPKAYSNQRNRAEYTLNDIITQNVTIKKLKDNIKKVANSSSSVLVYGETGTGKELFVHAIHNESYRKYKPFIPVNCAALPESLLEGILFGSQKGAFTGAENRKGLFEEADGGTIYLDEINSMPLNLQAKLLRTLQEKKVMPLGGSVPKKIDVRVIASINKAPSLVIEKGELRRDLFYRLNVINIIIPPLRERKEDILLLSSFFINKYNKKLGKQVKDISQHVKELFLSYEWPGNVRELEHIIEGAMNIVEGSIIKFKHLPVYLNKENQSFKTNINPLEGSHSLKEAVEQVEKKMISAALIKSGGNISKASKILKIPRTTLQYKIDKYNINTNI